MAAAAYAAVVSVINLVDQLNKYTVHPIFFDRKQIQYLREKVVFLQDFLERHSEEESEQVRALDTRIRDAAHGAEDVIEAHVVDQLSDGFTPYWKENLPFLRDLEKVIQDMDSIEKIARVIQDRSKVKDQESKTYLRPGASLSRAPASGKRVMVGFEDERKQIMERLTDIYSSQNQRVIPIVGMGGSGKTTLAEHVYDDPFIAQHFDIRIWVTVSHDYTVHDILLQIPVCQKEQESTKDLVTEHKLKKVLYQSLFNRRYLLILDDVWSLEVWDELKLFLPDNDGKSRIILTTRILPVAHHFGSCVVRMRCLDWDESWSMFCEYAFAQDVCPHDLEMIMKEIVGKCKGLPLSVAVMGGLVATSPRTEKYLGNIVKDVNSILNSEDDDYCLDVLSLSYKYLPIHLKPCFLYMGLFAEDHRIECEDLCQLWVSEGFLKSDDKNQKLEAVAVRYIKDLADRNLISHRSVYNEDRGYWRWRWEIHDLLRDLSQRVAGNEGFYCVLRKADLRHSMHWERRLSLPERIDVKKVLAMQTTSLACTLICGGVCRREAECTSRLLRVMYGVEIDSPEKILRQLNLRNVQYRCNMPSSFNLPSSISLLWNLQVLECNDSLKVSAPSEIWEMPQLRSIWFKEICLPDPPSQVDEQDVIVLENLHTLGYVVNFKCCEQVLKRIPHIEYLDISYDDFLEKDDTTSDYYCLLNLYRFPKLDLLEIGFNTGPSRIELIRKLTFPSSLRTLRLYTCKLFWDDVSMIGMLPHLENLLLDEVEGREWTPADGQFRSLETLFVHSCIDLIKWNADSSHFPVLQQCQLKSLRKLEELPSDIGDIPTLELIELGECKATAAISTITILEKQESFGDDILRINVKFKNMEEFKLFQATLKSEGKESISNRLQVLWPRGVP